MHRNQDCISVSNTLCILSFQPVAGTSYTCHHVSSYPERKLEEIDRAKQTITRNASNVMLCITLHSIIHYQTLGAPADSKKHVTDYFSFWLVAVAHKHRRRRCHQQHHHHHHHSTSDIAHGISSPNRSRTSTSQPRTCFSPSIVIALEKIKSKAENPFSINISDRVNKCPWSTSYACLTRKVSNLKAPVTHITWKG